MNSLGIGNDVLIMDLEKKLPQSSFKQAKLESFQDILGVMD